MRRTFGRALVVAGLLTVTFVGGRYATAAVRADKARQAWNEESARQSVAAARMAFVANERSSRVRGEPVSRLVIPKIDLDEIVLEGVGEDELTGGPGHLPSSALPGERGNAVISAHRDRHFRNFDRLTVGDAIATEANGQVITWRVVSIRVIDKDAPALFWASTPTLTLTTCWPIRYFGTAPERLIVTAKPASEVFPRVARAPTATSGSD